MYPAMDKQKVVYPYGGLLFGHKNEQSAVRWKNLENITLDERSQSQRKT